MMVNSCACSVHHTYKGVLYVSVSTVSMKGAINRGSYMNAHVLLNFLNELGKRVKVRGLSNISYHFCNEFNKFNNTVARMFDSVYHMT